VIAAHLVVGAAVGRAEVDVFESAVAHPEGDADEPTCAAGRSLGRTAGQLKVDRAVVKVAVFQRGVRLSVRRVSVFGDSDRALSPEFDRFQFHAMRYQLIDGLSCSAPRERAQERYRNTHDHADVVRHPHFCLHASSLENWFQSLITS
jgi:hypothetical protein